MSERDEAEKMRRHLIERHDEDDESVEGMVRESREERGLDESDEFLLELIHNRQHTSLDWDAGHDEGDIDHSPPVR